MVIKVSEGQFSMFTLGAQNSVGLKSVLAAKNQRVQLQGVPESFPSDRACNLLSYKSDLIVIVWS